MEGTLSRWDLGTYPAITLSDHHQRELPSPSCWGRLPIPGADFSPHVPFRAAARRKMINSILLELCKRTTSEPILARLAEPDVPLSRYLGSLETSKAQCLTFVAAFLQPDPIQGHSSPSAFLKGRFLSSGWVKPLPPTVILTLAASGFSGAINYLCWFQYPPSPMSAYLS